MSWPWTVASWLSKNTSMAEMTKTEWHDLRERLLFKTDLSAFSNECEHVRKHYGDEFPRSSEARKLEIGAILSELTLDLLSYLPRWRLQDPANPVRLSDEEIREQAERNCRLLVCWGMENKVESMRSAARAIARSNLLKLSRMTDLGLINNRWGNDAAVGLTDAVRRGAVLVTTNPIMINAVRKDDPATWDRVREEFKRALPGSSPEQRASLMTMSVVLENCRELRPIYEATKGAYGYVSLQINPRANREASRMAEEVEDLYDRLTQELHGPPNAVFKIPATRAGLEAVRRLTSKGIGCTVTVNCSVDQNLAFGEVIEQGCARLSFLVVMTGRLDDPIRDELRERGLTDASQVAKWASTAVLRRSYELLYRQKKYKKSALLTASLRGPWNIEGSITNEEAPVFITCFPDKAREYDSVEREMTARIREEIPDELMTKLMRSRIFRQAYEAGGLTPDGFDTFYPVVATLDAFSKSYDEFLEYNR